MKDELIKHVLEAIENALRDDGGAEKILEILIKRKNTNVEEKGEQAAQLTFDLRTRLDMNNNEIKATATLDLLEKTKFSYKGESIFTLNFEQPDLPMQTEKSKTA